MDDGFDAVAAGALEVDAGFGGAEGAAGGVGEGHAGFAGEFGGDGGFRAGFNVGDWVTPGLAGEGDLGEAGGGFVYEGDDWGAGKLADDDEAAATGGRGAGSGGRSTRTRSATSRKPLPPRPAPAGDPGGSLSKGRLLLFFDKPGQYLRALYLF